MRLASRGSYIYINTTEVVFFVGGDRPNRLDQMSKVKDLSK